MPKKPNSKRIYLGGTPPSKQSTEKPILLTDFKMRLKDGSISYDKRLDRIVEFDERSKNYPIRTLLPDREPRSYTWNFYPDATAGPLDQGRDGSCVGFAWTHELGIRPLAVHKNKKFAKETVYWEAQKIDYWDGGSYPGANPQYEGTSILAGAKILHKMNAFQEYRWAFGLQDLIQTIGFHGPAVIGVYWHEGMYNPDEKGYIHVTGPIYGGHAVVVAGIDVKEECFKIINSWGKGWGRPQNDLLPGWCKISFSDMDNLLQKQGEVCIPSIRRTSEFGEKLIN